MRNSVRNGRQTALAAVTGAVFVAMGTYILVMTNRVDSTVEMNAVTVVVFGIGTWCYLKFVVHRRTDFGEGSMRLRELFTDRVIATNEVASVHSDDGLYCLLRGGRRVDFPGFEPSVIGRMRRYRGYSEGLATIERALADRRPEEAVPPVAHRFVFRVDLGLLASSFGFHLLVLWLASIL